MSQPGSKSR